MAITEGVQEQWPHYFMCFSSQHVPVRFSDLGPAPASSEAKGYRDKVCELLHIIAICRDHYVHHPHSHFWLSWARVLTLHTPPQQK